MKKILLIILILILALVSLIFYIYKDKPINAPKFDLAEKYYISSEYKEINELESLIKQEESFVVFVYQPDSIASSNFEAVLDEFLKNNYMTIYKISSENLKQTKYKNQIKNYPSFMVFYKGQLSSYLDIKENAESFKKTDDFAEWLESKIVLKPRVDNENNSTKIEDTTDITLTDIQKEPGKVNIYMFWGNGCPHCKALKEFLSSIQSTHGHLFNLHTYEVWYDAENKELMKLFSSYDNTQVNGVPYTIIGEKTFIGFSENTKESIIKAIEEESMKDYDLYIDKILKN